MDIPVTQLCMRMDDMVRALDTAAWFNFKHRSISSEPLFSVIDPPGNEYIVVSRDILELYTNPNTEPNITDYSGMDYDLIQLIATDPDPLDHWEDIRGMISTVDGDILRFILAYNVPLDRFIKQELGARGYNENGVWIGLEKAKEIWLND